MGGQGSWVLEGEKVRKCKKYRRRNLLASVLNNNTVDDNERGTDNDR